MAQATTYWVSTTGNDSNPGTQAAPFQHVSKGAAAAQAGDTVMVMDGTYGNEGQLADPNTIGAVVTVTNSGTAGAPITIMAQHRGMAILDASSTVQSSMGCYAAWSYFDVSYVSYVVIQGFVLENSCIHGVRVNGTAHDITIRWNTMQDIGNWNNTAGTGNTTGIPAGVYLNSSEYNITFDGNIFTNIGGGTNVNQQHAIYTSASNVTIVNNVFYNNVHGWDIQVAGTNNLVVANNTFAFDNPSRDGQIILWDDGIANSLQNIVIQNNVFYAPQNYAVVTELDGGGSIGGCTFENNLTTVSAIYDNGSSCSQSNNSTNSNPNLINTSSAPYNFDLQGGSPAIGAGMTNSYTTVDFNGTSRSGAAYDVGAYKYATPVTIQLAATPASVSLLQGGLSTSAIALTMTGSSDPAFTVSGVPSGVTATVSPSSCSGSCTAVLTIGASSSYQGSAQISVTASSGSVSGSTTVALSVIPPPAAPPAAPSSSPDYTSGLAAEWKLIGNAIDSVAGDNGTLHHGAGWATADIFAPLRVLHLNGTTGYVSAPEKPQTEMSDQMTVSAWVFNTQSSDGQRIVAKVYDWDIKLNGGHPQFTAGSDYAITNYSLPLNAWTHIAFTFSSGTVTAYINGQPVGLAANTFTSGYSLPAYQYGLNIGADSSLANFFAGYLSDLRVYNRALAAADISALYAAASTGVE